MIGEGQVYMTGTTFGRLSKAKGPCIKNVEMGVEGFLGDHETSSVYINESWNFYGLFWWAISYVLLKGYEHKLSKLPIKKIQKK